MSSWTGPPMPPAPHFGAMGWFRVAWRGMAMATVVFGCLGLLILVRLVERPLHGHARPWTPHITQFVCRMSLAILRLRLRVQGGAATHNAAFVANHGSWLDIFVLNAADRVTFVAKSEVAGWPGIGWLARATGTLFIRRDRREAAAQTRLMAERLELGERLLFFPEGTSTDARRVLPFKPTLFGAFFSADLPDGLAVQPITVIYHAPPGERPDFYGWWGEMTYGGHLLRMLAHGSHGQVDVLFHPPLPVADFADRKVLARTAERNVRAALRTGLAPGAYIEATDPAAPHRSAG